MINNWFPAIASYSGEVTASKSSSGMGSLSRIKAIVQQKPFYGKDNYLTLTNNISYAYRAEALGWPIEDSPPGWNWTGKVGAYGMVNKAVISMKAKYMI